MYTCKVNFTSKSGRIYSYSEEITKQEYNSLSKEEQKNFDLKESESVWWNDEDWLDRSSEVMHFSTGN